VGLWVETERGKEIDPTKRKGRKRYSLGTWWDALNHNMESSKGKGVVTRISDLPWKNSAAWDRKINKILTGPGSSEED